MPVGAYPGSRDSACFRAGRALPLLAAVALAASPALAQQANPLRGAVAEGQIDQELLRQVPLEPPTQAVAEGIPVPPYSPSSPGAVDDEETDNDPRSMFETGSNSPDSFPESALPIPSRPPSTAGRRNENTPDRPQQARSTIEQPEEEGELTTGGVRDGLIDPETGLQVDERAEAIERLERRAEENPYAPLGLRLGTFNVTSSLESGLTATSNADSSPNGESATLSESILRLNAISDWSRHSAAFEAYGSLRESISGAELDEKIGGVKGLLDLDIARDLRATAGASYTIQPESASSPVVIEDTVSRPIRQTLTGSLGLEKELGGAQFGIAGNVDRDWFGDADLASGGDLSQRDRNSTLVAATLRGGYEISPALTPFAEIEGGRRIYDEELDSAGFARSADRLGARAGLEIDLGEKLSGEFSAGWLQEKSDDDRLETISGPAVNADLLWSPVRGTNVSLAGSTVVEGTTTPGESGSILYANRLTVERKLRANLMGNIALGAAWRDYIGTDGHDLILAAEAGATYWFNRYAGLAGRVRHESLRSNLPGRDYETNSVFLGVKLQR
jgi:hypothetical protein